MVEAFKTNVQEVNEANKIIQELMEQFPTHKINFDFEDCDRILRMEGHELNSTDNVTLLNSEKYYCEILEC